MKTIRFWESEHESEKGGRGKKELRSVGKSSPLKIKVRFADRPERSRLRALNSVTISPPASSLPCLYSNLQSFYTTQSLQQLQLYSGSACLQPNSHDLKLNSSASRHDGPRKRLMERERPSLRRRQLLRRQFLPLGPKSPHIHGQPS